MAYGLVERRRRAVARLALYGSLLLVGCGTLLARYYLQLPPRGSGETRWLNEDWAAFPAVRLLQQYLRVDTTPTTGDAYAGALFLATPLEAAGLDVHVERVGAHDANLWAELRGVDPRPLVLLNHIDVEPVGDVAAWEHPPFAGVLRPPWLHGRGAFDMKSYTAAQLLAVLDLAARGRPPARSVLFVATSGEESGSDLGVRWLLREHPAVLRNAWAVMTEGGVVEARSIEDPKYWGTDVGQRRFVEVLACAPTRQRLQELSDDLVQRAGEQPVVVDPKVRRFWDVYSASRDLAELRAQLANPEELPHDRGRYLGLPAYMQAMLRDEIVTFVPTPAAGGGGWEMRLMMMLLPDSDPEARTRELLPAWLTAGVEITTDRLGPPSVLSPLDHPLLQAIDAEVKRRHPRVVTGPFFHPWTATDARFLRPLGIPTYGFSPFLILSTDAGHIHRPNERVPLTTFVDGVELYRDVVRRAAG